MLNIYNSITILQYFILVIIGVIFLKKISELLAKRINRITAYVIAVIVTISITAIYYTVVKAYINIPSQSDVIILMLVYIVTMVVLETFLSIRRGCFTVADRMKVFLYIIITIAVYAMLVWLSGYIGQEYKKYLLLAGLLQLMLAYIFYSISVRLYEENYNEKEADRLRNKINLGEDYLKNVQAMDKQIRVIKHDMKNQLQTFTELIKSKKYDEAEQFLKMYGMNLESTQDYIHTDNLLFNTIINNKIQYAKSEKIIVSSSINKKIKQMKDNDLCTVIGNLIDNAIEAELRENEYREIEISSFWNGEECVFRIGNFVSKSVLDNNEELQTVKADKVSHGLGTQIIRNLMKKNKGICDYYEEGEMFYCTIRW